MERRDDRQRPRHGHRQLRLARLSSATSRAPRCSTSSTPRPTPPSCRSRPLVPAQGDTGHQMELPHLRHPPRDPGDGRRTEGPSGPGADLFGMLRDEVLKPAKVGPDALTTAAHGQLAHRGAVRRLRHVLDPGRHRQGREAARRRPRRRRRPAGAAPGPARREPAALPRRPRAHDQRPTRSVTTTGSGPATSAAQTTPRTPHRSRFRSCRASAGSPSRSCPTARATTSSATTTSSPGAA